MGFEGFGFGHRDRSSGILVDGSMSTVMAIPGRGLGVQEKILGFRVGGLRVRGSRRTWRFRGFDGFRLGLQADLGCPFQWSMRISGFRLLHRWQTWFHRRVLEWQHGGSCQSRRRPISVLVEASLSNAGTGRSKEELMAVGLGLARDGRSRAAGDGQAGPTRGGRWRWPAWTAEAGA